jgi:hypothetical protein
MKAKFLNKGGYKLEREDAAKVFNTEDEYEIISGIIYGSSSYFYFKDIPGQWNTVMFDVDWQDAADIMIHNY